MQLPVRLSYWTMSSSCGGFRSLRSVATKGPLPAVRVERFPELHQPQGIKPGTVRHAFLALAEEGLVHIRHGRPTTIADEPA